MAYEQTLSPIFLNDTDGNISGISMVLAVLEEINGSNLAFVPLKDAKERKLSFIFSVPPKPEEGSNVSIPLVLAGRGRHVSLYNLTGYRLAHVTTNPDQSDMVYINYNLLVFQGQDLPPGISLSILDMSEFLPKPKILGLSADGRLGLDTDGRTINNGTAKGYAIMGSGDDRFGLDNTIKELIDRSSMATTTHPHNVQSARLKWSWSIVPLILVVFVCILLNGYREID